MTESSSLLVCIFSESGQKLISHFPLNDKEPLSIEKIAKKAGVPKSTAHRLIKKLSQWNNIKVIKSRMRGPPLTLYSLKSYQVLVDMRKKQLITGKLFVIE